MLILYLRGCVQGGHDLHMKTSSSRLSIPKLVAPTHVEPATGTP